MCVLKWEYVSFEFQIFLWHESRAVPICVFKPCLLADFMIPGFLFLKQEYHVLFLARTQLGGQGGFTLGDRGKHTGLGDPRHVLFLQEITCDTGILVSEAEPLELQNHPKDQV